MTRIIEGDLTIDFPLDWKVTKFDAWSFYRNQFANADAREPCSHCETRNRVGPKAVDIIAVDGACCWCIEIKDYRQHRRTKTVALADEVALKVRDTLAALVAAQANANDATERDLARKAVRCTRLRVVIHLEQPPRLSQLSQRTINPAVVLQRLKQLIKSIDPHPLVVDKDAMGSVAWSVT